MWTWMLGTALAAAPVEEIVQDHAPPYVVRITDEGHLIVTDAVGDSLDPDETLDLMGLAEEARDYRANRGVRKASMLVLVSAGSLISTAALFEEEPVTFGVGALAAGCGLTLLYAPSANHLEDWTDVDTVVERLSDSPYLPRPGTSRTEAPRPAVTTPPNLWTLTGDGTVQTADGRRVQTSEIAHAMGDSPRAAAYEVWRREQRLTWSAMTTVGFATAVGGLLVYQQADLDEARDAGLATAPVGAAMVVGGIVGITRMDRPALATRWFSPAEIEAAVAGHNATQVPAPPTGPEGTAWTIRPVVGPTWLGLTGTF